MRRIASHYALIDGELLKGIVVEVDDSGTITSISHHDNIDSLAGVEFYPGVLMPGMVNAHCHLELSYLRGAIAEGTGFAGFAREIGRVRGNYTNEERIHAASIADSEMWSEGVEAVVDIANDELVMPIKEHSSIHYLTLFEAFGLILQSPEAQWAMANRHTNAGATPHSTYSLQDATFRDIANLGSHPLSIHLLESADESALYHHSGSLWEWYERMGWECDFLHYGTPTERVVRSIPRGRGIILVHGCMAQAEDIERLSVFSPAWALCPESNRYISGIKPPVQLFRSMGANIVIGTDSLASARRLSMVDNMRLLGDDIPLAELLTYATLNGARAMGIEATKGSLEVGKRPGIVVLSNLDLHGLRLTEDSQTNRVI